MTTWDDHVKSWSHPPVDDVGYIPSAEMIAWSDHKLEAAIADMRRARYTGWRNHGGLWREMLRLDDTHGKDVLDFGCGVGLEALELQDAGNRVSLADISGSNLSLAYRVLSLSQNRPATVDTYLVIDEQPYISCPDGTFDVIHCSGVLHHIPWAREIVERFHDMLRPGGEVRLMLYSDYGWCVATGNRNPPHWTAMAKDLDGFERFVRYFDSVGEYADFYTRDKLMNWFGDLFDVDDFAYLTEDARFCAAVLTRKDHRG